MMKSRLVVGGNDVSFVSELTMSQTRAIADSIEGAYINGEITNTIFIPGSPEVRRMFEFYDDVNSVGNNFNPKIITEVQYFVNEIRVFNGSLQLVDCTKTIQENDVEVTYECIMFGDNNNIFMAIAGLKLSDIDFSDLDHLLTFSFPFLSDSKVNAPVAGSGYVYPFIDYGLGDGTFAVPQTAQWDVTRLKPAIFEVEYLRRIFSNAGYSWSSGGNYFDSFHESQIIIPCVSSGALQIDATTKADSAFRAGLSANSNQSTAGVPGTIYTYSPASRTPVAFNDDSSGSNFDPSAAFNTGTFIWTAPISAWYDIASVVNFEVEITPPATTTDYVGVINIDFAIEKFNVSWNSIGGGTMNINVNQSSGAVYSFNTGYQLSVPNQLLQAGDQIRITMTNQNAAISYVNIATPITSGASTLELNIQGGTGTFSSVFSAQIKRADLPYGGTVVMNDLIPRDITQIDFLTSIIRCENLKFEPTAADPTVYDVFVREDFYDYTDILDWTTKLDVSSEIKVTPMVASAYGNYKWTYKEDQDHYNKLYQDAYGEVYGTHKENSGIDFNKEEKVIEVVFSATPVANWNQSKVIAPRFYQMQPDQSSGLSFVKPVEVNIRRLYYAIVYDPFAVVGITYGTTTEVLAGYPYAGDVGNPYVPTVDLNFGTPRTLFWNFPGQQYTTNTRYNERYSKWFQEITHRDSKRVTMSLYLTENDIATFSFRKVAWIIDSYYLVEKIVNYDPQTTSLTQFEFLKLKQGEAFVAETIFVEEYDDVGNSGSSNRSSRNGMSVGQDNNNGGSASFVTGDNNIIGDGASNVNLIGSSNVRVSGQVENFTGMHLEDEDIDQTSSNTFKSGRIFDSQVKNRTTTVTADFMVSTEYHTYFIDATSADITGTLIDIGEKITIIRIDGTANAVSIEDDGGADINGNVSVSMPAQYDKLVLNYSGTEWYY